LAPSNSVNQRRRTKRPGVSVRQKSELFLTERA
jgi:hypothetical protein